MERIIDQFTDDELRELLRAILVAIHGRERPEDAARVEEVLRRRKTR